MNDANRDVRARVEALQLITKPGTDVGVGWAESVVTGQTVPLIMFALERGPVFIQLNSRDMAASLIDALSALLAKGPPSESIRRSDLLLPGGF